MEAHCLYSGSHSDGQGSLARGQRDLVLGRTLGSSLAGCGTMKLLVTNETVGTLLAVHVNKHVRMPLLLPIDAIELAIRASSCPRRSSTGGLLLLLLFS